jgi:hypothetical protein
MAICFVASLANADVLAAQSSLHLTIFDLIQPETITVRTP